MSLLGDDVVGRSGHVSVAIPGPDKPGEVVVRIRGGSEAYIAYSDQPVETGAEVVVVSDRGARTLFVAPL
ncbi:MAG: NfeD family protein [Acidimicrobiales bacterium]